jgi:hypothetical protein
MNAMDLEEALTRALQGDNHVKIEVRYEGGMYTAWREGQPGKVFDERRSAAISKARSWRAFHSNQSRPSCKQFERERNAA